MIRGIKCPRCGDSARIVYLGKGLKGNKYGCNLCGNAWTVKFTKGVK